MSLVVKICNAHIYTTLTCFVNVGRGIHVFVGRSTQIGFFQRKHCGTAYGPYVLYIIIRTKA